MIDQVFDVTPSLPKDKRPNLCTDPRLQMAIEAVTNGSLDSMNPFDPARVLWREPSLDHPKTEEMIEFLNEFFPLWYEDSPLEWGISHFPNVSV